MGWWRRLGASMAKRKLCRVCFGEQVTRNGALVCVDCDYAITWDKHRTNICRHQPACGPTMRKAEQK